MLSLGLGVNRIGASLKALINNGLTNLFESPQAFDAAAWTKSGVTVAANAVMAPDGTMTADTLTVTAAATPSVFQEEALTAGQSYTISCFMERGTTSHGYFQLNVSAPGTLALYVAFDLVNGTAGPAVDLIAGITVTETKITALPSGRYLCQFTFTAPANSISCNLYIGPSTGARDSVVGHTIHLWQAQLVAGSNAGPIAYA